MSFETSQPITARLDGSFVVQHEGQPYHVVDKALDPFGIFDLEEVRGFAAAHPELVEAEPEIDPLVGTKTELKRRIDAAIPILRKAGFDYAGTNYQADPGVTEALNGVLVALSAGVPVAFPIRWRSGDNARPSWASPEAFTSFAAAVLSFVDGLYQRAFDDKDAIDQASNADLAQAVFNRGPWAKGAI